MPALFSSAGAFPNDFGSVVFAGASTSGSVTGSINVPTASDQLAVAAVLWAGNVDASGATVGATLGGSAMTRLGSPLLWDSNKARLDVFTLADPTSGPGKSVVASFSGMGTEAGQREFIPVAVIYSGVNTVGSPVTAGGSATTSNSVTVSSVAAAHRVVTVHAALSLVSGHFNSLDDGVAVNHALRARGTLLLTDCILIQDAPGTTSVTGTAANSVNNASWGAVGFNLTPAIVNGDASLSAVINLSSSGALFRVENPDPHRTWVIDA